MKFNPISLGMFSTSSVWECVAGQVGSAFTLYAYSNGLSGQQVFWADGLFLFSSPFPSDLDY